MDIKNMAARIASRVITATDLCVVCGKPGEEIRYSAKGMDRTPLSGRVFVKGTVLCETHLEMLGGF